LRLRIVRKPHVQRNALGVRDVNAGSVIEADAFRCYGGAKVSEPQTDGSKIHTPAEIAETLGSITVKTLSALIRSRGLETTTLGYAPPSPKGGPPRRLWGMTDAQLDTLLTLRKGRGTDGAANRASHE
jgi:hypothetical protein